MGASRSYQDNPSYNARDEGTNEDMDAYMDSTERAEVDKIQVYKESHNLHHRHFQQMERMCPEAQAAFNGIM